MDAYSPLLESFGRGECMYILRLALDTIRVIRFTSETFARFFLLLGFLYASDEGVYGPLLRHGIFLVAEYYFPYSEIFVSQ